jgi:hypothetical protein
MADPLAFPVSMIPTTDHRSFHEKPAARAISAVMSAASSWTPEG